MVMMIAVVGLGALLVLGLARVAAAAVLRARADTAADAAALAAADALALGKDSGAAVADARTTARANGARLEHCDCEGSAAEVLVVVDAPPGLHLASRVTGKARAEVDQRARFSDP
jgi:secretion/DNA translocation related TadE-like protein